MRIISMHKVDASMEAGALPSQALLEGMGKLIGDMNEAGILRGGDGLKPSATRVRLRLAGGKQTLQHGPYAGANELVAAIVMLQVKDMEEAIGWASRYAQALGDVELELGPVTEAWDLGVMAKPAAAPLRCLVLHKGDAASEAGKPLGKAASSALDKLFDEMRKAGVLLLAERLQPSRAGLRIKVAGKQESVIDGPFAESKELVAGFVILEVASLQEARRWCSRFAAVIGDVEMDLRVLSEPESA